MAQGTTIPIWHDYLFLGTHGHVVALRKATGEKLWQTSLPSTGYSVVSILVEDDKLFCASGGHAFALDPQDGKILWTNDLKGLGQGLVYLTTANSNDTEALLTVLAGEAAAQAAVAAGSAT